MRDNLNIDLVFPIRDEVSAWLMCLKADLLYDAGVINDNKLNDVIERAAAAIDQSEKVAGEPPHTPNWRPEWNERRRGFPWDHERPGDEVRDLTGKSGQVRKCSLYPVASLRRTTIQVFHSKRRPVDSGRRADQSDQSIRGKKSKGR